MSQKIYKTMQGRAVDLDSLRIQNELTPAIGNASLNARGDQIDAQGNIIKTREEIAAEQVVPTKNTVLRLSLIHI
jgi:hypothetical protein